MIDLSLSALAKAWLTAMIASGVLVVALTVARFCTDDVYLQGLEQALQLNGEYPSPNIDDGNGEYSGGSVQAYGARAGHTGS